MDLTGLSSDEASVRLRAEGENELPQLDRRTPLHIVLEVLREPMLSLLLAGGFIYLVLGNLKEAIVLLVFAAMSVVITVVQEIRTERVLESLKEMTSPRAIVIRDGKRTRIAGRDVVRGDLVLLEEGGRIPADGHLIEGQDIAVDESLLTGESIPVRKRAALLSSAPQMGRPGGEDQPFVFSGSLVVRGSGIAIVVATGPRSEIGRIGQTLRSLDTEVPRLQAQTAHLVRLAAFGGVAVSVLAVILYGTLRGGWLNALLAGVAIGMSMLPEEFPVVLAVFMAMGAWRISKARVLTRRASAIETLGAATVLCTDKTGTLTQNRMTISELRLPDGSSLNASDIKANEITSKFGDLAFYGALACVPNPFDPMEKAFHTFAEDNLGAKSKLLSAGWSHVHSYGIRANLLAVTHLWRMPDSHEFIVAAKGAPEAIARLCGLDKVESKKVHEAANAMAVHGQRVLGVARATYDGALLPHFPDKFNFQFLGLVGLADPLRQGVPTAVNECRSAGIRVVMITGDYPETARAVASQAGLDVSDVVTGTELDALDAAGLAKRIKTANVFARILPEQKLRIVEALKADGEIVAMTGDGVNDAPSLKAAHIGIAMGARGTDVAREASSLVLLDDDFHSIVSAIRLGRRIYDNIRKALSFIFAVHVPIAGLALLPLLLGLSVIFTPIHIAFLEMIIDPVCSLVFEAEIEERDVMKRAPRPPEAPIFSRSLVAWSILQGAIAFGLVALVFLEASYRGMHENEVRALVFVALVASIVSLILVNRSFGTSPTDIFARPNLILILLLFAVAGILALSLLWPNAMALFKFGSLHSGDLAYAAIAAIATLISLEFIKSVWRTY